MPTRAELELKLGPRDSFMLTADNFMWLREWAKVIGRHDPMSRVDLVNLYHNPPDVVVTPEQAEAAQELYNAMMGIQPEPEPVPVANHLHHKATAEVLTVARLGHPVMMVGPAGCGKTTIGEHVAAALNLPFYITSTVFDTHELMGFVDGYGKYHATPFRKAYEQGGVWVADEIDAWDAAALLAANSALAQGLVTFPDNPEPVRRHANFRMIATANTFGKGADRVYVGRNELDAASLDRYAIIEVDYDNAIEMQVCKANIGWLEYVRDVREQVTTHKIRHVVSTRAVGMGAQALAAGLKVDRVRELYVFKGMSKSDRQKLKGV